MLWPEIGYAPTANGGGGPFEDAAVRRTRRNTGAGTVQAYCHHVATSLLFKHMPPFRLRDGGYFGALIDSKVAESQPKVTEQSIERVRVNFDAK